MGKQEKQENIIEKIKNKYSYAVSDVAIDHNCELKLDGHTDFVILKSEKIIKKKKNCDFIIFINDIEIKIIVTEYKSTNFDIYHIINQLQNSAEPANEIFNENNNNERYRFFFVALAQKWSRDELRILTNRRYYINIDSKKLMIIPNTCGNSFNKILKELKASRHDLSILIDDLVKR